MPLSFSRVVRWQKSMKEEEAARLLKARRLKRRQMAPVTT